MPRNCAAGLTEPAAEYKKQLRRNYLTTSCSPAGHFNQAAVWSAPAKLGQQLRRLVSACVASPPSSSSERPQSRVILLGLDGAGKTSLLDRLVGERDDSAAAASTSGCRIRSALGFEIVDVPGDARLRPLWRYYAAPRRDLAQAVVFVVDGADSSARLDEAGRELAGVLSDSVELAGVPVLALASKRDLPGCSSLARIRDALQLDRLAESRTCQLMAVSAATGDGLLEARQLLERLVEENRRFTRRRRRYSRRRHEREIWRRLTAPPPPPPPPAQTLVDLGSRL